MPGGCHCGDVRFEIEADLGVETVLDCNCSICTKKGILHLIVPPARFKLVQGRDKLTTYTFGTHTAKHSFCARCGMHPFYTPRSHPEHVDVNVRCLDAIDVRALRIEHFDGLNWEDNVASIQGAQA
jgi:hypothetical protein